MKPMIPALAGLLMLAPAPLLAQPASAAGGIQAATPWARPAAVGMNAAGFVSLSNRGARPDALVGAHSAWARAVELHQSSMVGGVMRMSRVPSLPLAPGQVVELRPGGYHLMLLGLKRPLRTGDRLPIDLTFASGARTQVVFLVGAGRAPSQAPGQAPGQAKPNADHSEHMGH